MELVVSTLKSLDEFYCYNYSAGGEIVVGVLDSLRICLDRLLLTCSAEVHVLTDLTHELMKHCESQRAPFTATVGEPCCALFPGKSKFTEIKLTYIYWFLCHYFT